MIESEALVANDLGLHLRAATFLVQRATRFVSDIKLAVDGELADAKSILGLLMLGLEKGTRVRIQVSGADERQASRAIQETFEERFGEDI